MSSRQLPRGFFQKGGEGQQYLEAVESGELTVDEVVEALGASTSESVKAAYRKFLMYKGKVEPDEYIDFSVKPPVPRTGRPHRVASSLVVVRPSDLLEAAIKAMINYAVPEAVDRLAEKDKEINALKNRVRMLEDQVLETKSELEKKTAMWTADALRRAGGHGGD